MAKQRAPSVIFVGNPGVGKSSLLNVLMGKNQFTAGFSAGCGLTQEWACAEKDGVKYFDVPGLADANDPQKAAAAWTHALQSCGPLTRVFVVVRLSDGRVSRQDQVTIRMLLDAAPDIQKGKYGIVINRVTPAEDAKLTNFANKKDVQEHLMKLVLPNKTTEDFFYQLEVPALAGVNELTDAQYEACRQQLAPFETWVRRVFIATIHSENVRPVRDGDYHEMARRAQALEAEVMMLKAQVKKQQDESAARWLGGGIAIAVASVGVAATAPVVLPLAVTLGYIGYRVRRWWRGGA